jgi:hypothetical protein
MIRRYCWLVLCWGWVGWSSAQAAPFFVLTNENPPAQVEDGLDQYRDQGVDRAWTTWSKGSAALEDNAVALKGKLSGYLEQYGKVDRWTQVATFRMVQSLRFSYFVIGYQTGVAYLEIVSYQAPAGWVVTDIKVSDDYREVFPEFVQALGGSF